MKQIVILFVIALLVINACVETVASHDLTYNTIVSRSNQQKALVIGNSSYERNPLKNGSLGYFGVIKTCINNT